MCDCSQFRAGGIVLIQFFLYSKIFFPVCFSGACKIYQPKKQQQQKKIPSIEICFSTLRSALEERTNLCSVVQGSMGSSGTELNFVIEPA